MNSKYLRKENEEDLDYAMRLIDIKKEEKPDDLDWADIVDLLGLDLNKDSLRKSQDTIFGGIAVYNAMKKRELSKEPIDYQNEVEVQLQELKKARIKLSDERAALNRRIRNEARREDLFNLAKECANTIAEKDTIKVKPLSEASTDPSNKVALLTLSDFHYGLRIEEFNNEYNDVIFEVRINKLLNKTIEYLKLNDINKIYVLGLGDYLSGVIHLTTRIENKENIVEQTTKISEYLFKFLSALSIYAEVFYCDVSDNHGRIFSKDDSLKEDNFSLFIKWYLKARFSDNESVHIIDNEINNEIGTIEIFGRNYGFTHGHRDKIGDMVQNLSLMTKRFYDAIFTAHLHHFEANEVHGTYLYMNGTFSGTDSYANNLRRTSNPSQNLFIISEQEGIECQYLIKL